ncbi:MAG: hypothetical protein BWY94_02496 [Actinobacteria bacterium ADurb.BinA094]|nr:MAG: hypothetical protein BWY94_02496 [Actinobacteria bacterium ADurb.BinA094]
MAVLLPLDAGEGAGTHPRRIVLVLLPDVLDRDPGPHVLRQNRHPVTDHVGLGLAAGEPHRVVVDRRDPLDRFGLGDDVGGLLGVVDDEVVRVGDVPGGERHTVAPLGGVADRERPGEAVVADAPVGGQTRRVLALHRRQLGGVEADQRVVGEVPHLVRRRLEADERIEVVRLARPADLVHDLAGVAGGRGRGVRRVALGAGRVHGQRQTERERHRDHEQDEERAETSGLTHGHLFSIADARRADRAPRTGGRLTPIVSHRRRAANSPSRRDGRGRRGQPGCAASTSPRPPSLTSPQ